VNATQAPGTGWPSLGIVVPVYNEAATIERGSREIAAVAECYAGRAVVITVEDGSEDGSGAILDQLADEVEALDVQRRSENGGYGAALRTGSARAQALGLDYVAFIDSDLTNRPADLLRMGELARDGYAYIKASRFVPGGGMVGVFPVRRLMTWMASVFCRVLFRTTVRDPTSGFRAVRTDLVCSWPLREPGFASIVEEFDWALRSGFEPVEFPTIIGGRTDEQRKSSFSWTPGLILSYMRFPLRAFWRRIRRLFRRER
jgi:dolichol-phosphate mannosyltransferase